MYPDEYEIEAAYTTLKDASIKLCRQSVVTDEIQILRSKIDRLETTLEKVINLLPPEIRLALELDDGE